MSITIKVVPADGRRVRYPDGRELPDKGDTVPRDSYWLRKIADGDVTEEAATPSKKKGEEA